MVCSDNMDVLISLISPNTTSADRQWRLAVAGETSGHWRIGFFFFFFCPSNSEQKHSFFSISIRIYYGLTMYGIFFLFQITKTFLS